MQRSCARLGFVWLLVIVTACGTGSVTTSPAGSNASTTAAIPTGASSTGEGELLVFAAASLTDAFTDIGRNFEAANPGVSVTFNFAGSQQLVQQISQGAPADVFASANPAQMDSIIVVGDVVSGTQRTFARNRLVVIHPKDNPAGLTKLEDLAQPGLKLVLAAKEVPVGGYSLDFLRKASELPQYTSAYSETVLANVVSYEENVRAVLSKIALGEADAGIVYSSDVTPDALDQVTRIDIPDALNTLATYPIAPIKNASQAALAQRFVDYVLTPEAQQVLTTHGFIAAEDAPSGATP